jgi:hypothetical protein
VNGTLSYFSGFYAPDYTNGGSGTISVQDAFHMEGNASSTALNPTDCSINVFSFGNGGASQYAKFCSPAQNLFSIIASAGVGIGTYNPSAQLEVNGTGQFDGALTVNGLLKLGPTNASVTQIEYPVCGDLDASCWVIREKFLPGSTTSAQIGAYGWATSAIGSGTCAASYGATVASGSNISINGGATSGYGCSLLLESAGTGPFSSLYAYTTPWDSSWGFELSTATTSEQVRIGYNNTSSAAIPNNWAGIRYDTTLQSLAGASYVSGGTASGTGTCDVLIYGGTATGTVPVVAGTITGGIITLTNSGGAGYNASASYTSAALSNGTGGTCSGTATIGSVSLSGAGTGGDTNFTFCLDSTTGLGAYIELCTPSSVAADTNLHKLRIRWIAQTEIAMSIFNAGLIQGTVVTFCPATLTTCTVAASPYTASQLPVAMIATATSSSRSLLLAWYTFMAWNLAL